MPVIYVAKTSSYARRITFVLEDTAFLCRKDNDHFLILPSVYEKLDLDDWLLAHLFFYDKDGKRCIGVELSEVD